MVTESIVKNERTGELSRRVKYTMSDLLEKSFQFAEEVSKNPPMYTFDQLVEDTGAMVIENRQQGRVLVIFDDESCVEYFRDSPKFFAHPASKLNDVAARDSRVPELKVVS